MAEKRKDFGNYGYEDERFEKELSDCRNLHCGICSNVFKDPVMCKNEHCFCRACITEYLKNSENCPCCNQNLSVESLTDAPRILKNLLSELRIRCDYHERGCEEFVQLGNLANHVATCVKAPVVCVNEECSSEMSREDQVRHESEEGRFRKVRCRNCKEMDAMMQEIRASLGSLCEHVGKLNTNVNEMKNAVEIRIGDVENKLEQLSETKTGLATMENRFEEKENQFLQMGDLGFKDKRRKARLDVESTRSDQGTQADLASDVQDVKYPEEYTYIVAGGYGKTVKKYVSRVGFRQEDELLNSVEIFDKTGNAWRELQSMKKCRAKASSIAYKGQVLVTGGLFDDGNILSSIEQFTRNLNSFSPPYWSNFSVNLPRALNGHASFVHNDRLLAIGGYNEEKIQSYLIYEIQLCFPFATKVLAKIPSSRPITQCGVVLLDDKILIFGGRERYESANANVTIYDITKNEFKELAPLPYKVRGMATVKYGDNVILVGGYAGGSQPKNTVISYNIETENNVMLPPMKDMRFQCRAVVDGDSVVVMGGHDGTSALKSVEAFDFSSSKWRNLPSMNEARRGFVAEIV